MRPKIQFTCLIFILALGFLVRLYKITNPIADWHSWRQADTAAVTRNFVKSGIDLFHPRYDDFSDVSGKGLFNPQGYRFVEFPIFNLLHYLLFIFTRPLGTLELWGRLTSVLSALVSAAMIFFLVRRRAPPTAALLASAFYLFLPYNIYFTRVILPDPLMVTLFLTTLNFFDLYLSSSKSLFFTLTLLFGSLAILVKPVAVFFLLPIFVKNLWLALAMLVPFGLWRIWSYRYPEGTPAALWLLNGNRIRFKPSFFQWLFGTRLGSLILGKWGLWPFLHGLTSSGGYFALWVIGALLYLIVFATGNVHHDYYQIPLIPIVAVLLGLGSVKLWQTGATYFQLWFNRLLLFVALAFALAFSWYDVRGLYQVNNWSIVKAGQAVDLLTPQDSVVVAPYGGDTAFLYQTRRPGFPFLPLPIKDLIDRFNARYYVSVNYDVETQRIMDKYLVIARTPEYVIVKLEEPILP